MQSIICRGCCSELKDIEKAKNIFLDTLSPLSENINQEQTVLADDKIETVSSGLELVDGYNVSKTDGLSPYLCDKCMEKLMAYVNFRKQLLSAQKLLNNSNPSLSERNNMRDPTEVDTSNRDMSPNILDKKVPKCEFVDSTENANNSLSITEQQSSPDDINVDDNSVSSVFTDSPINPRNNNLHESEASSLSIDIRISEENDFTDHPHDIETDIDVCSGEEDDVLELDIPSRKDETIEIGSSSESEIEVCDNDGDYVPIIKRVVQ